MSATEPPPTAESPSEVCTRLGLSLEAEIHVGFQSRVFVATGHKTRLIVKLVDDADIDSAVTDRIEIVRQLAEINPAVVGPVQLDSDLIVKTGGWHVICYPYVEGKAPSVDNPDDVDAMALTLSDLHASFRSLTATDLPPAPAFGGRADHHLAQGQLIHGDYATANLIITDVGLRVIDFDDCGQGSVEFEIGNSLYMVLFDAWHSADLDRYQRFRQRFVDAYRSASSLAVEDERLDEAIAVRIQSLQRWLRDPATAPLGIRTASPEWHRLLQSFIDDVL